MVPLPNLTENKYKLFIYRLADSDPDKYQFTDIVKTFFMVSDVRMVSEKDVPEGEVPIFDMSGYSLRHLAKITLPVVKKYMMYTQVQNKLDLFVALQHCLFSFHTLKILLNHNNYIII